uniref:Uncharacterized protein n=1 Tax=Anopheles atroparvus TaxID=41427 RepID=A0AAG5DCI5_ANOAO
MRRSCAASFCRSNYDTMTKHGVEIIFHKFPPESAQCRKWIQFCKRKANWKPTQNAALCSLHFKNEDYQLFESALAKSNINFKRLKLTAVPSISDVDAETDKKLLDYRHQVCRTCLRHWKNESLISVDSQVQNMTVLEMLIQLTAFETENNDAFPTMICLECKHKLEQAYNIRQEFIDQSELLVQLVAEEKMLEYFGNVSVYAHTSDKSRRPEESVMTDMSQECGSLVDDDFFNEDHEISDFDHDHENIENGIHRQPLNIPDINDHSFYTKILNEHEDIGVVVKEETCAEASASEAEDSSAQPITLKRNKTHASPSKSKGANVWGNGRRNYEHEKSDTMPSQKGGMRRGPRRQYNEAFQKKIRSLEEEARKRFPFTTCYVCDKEHETLIERDFHMQDHISMLPYECKECMEDNGVTSSAKENLVKDQPPVLKTMHQLHLHFRMHRMPYKCDKCYRRFSTVLKLNTHRWAMHECGGNGLTCEYCGKQYFHKIAFRKHVDSHRKKISEQFKCTICDRSFGVKSSLQRHEASHKGEKKYECMYCDKSFSTSYNRLTHQRAAHTGERPFKCPDCDRTFGQNASLKAHQALCTKDKVRPFRARICGPPLLPSKDGHCPYPGCEYTAKTYSSMYVHKREKHMPMYQCEVCNKSFAFKSKLRDHAMLHTGERPYKCQLCERSFRLTEMYRRHLLTHTSDSKHVCTICQKCFKLPQYLQAHMLTHSAERKFACEICGNSYKTRGELKKHNQRKHGDEIVEEVVVKTEDAFEVEYVDS